jgi:DNA-binding transcriptional regulator YiaG
MNMTKSQLRERLGLTDSQLADLFGITRSAVCQWDDDEPIPQPRQWQLQVLRPELFEHKQAA